MGSGEDIEKLVILFITGAGANFIYNNSQVHGEAGNISMILVNPTTDKLGPVSACSSDHKALSGFS